MIEIRYKVANKYLKEIRDIEVKSSDAKGMGDVVETLHCKYNEYLNTSLPFFRDSFNISLHTGHLANLIKQGAIKQVYFDTDTNQEVSKTDYLKQLNNTANTNSDDISLKDFLKANDVSLNDFKQLLIMAKQMKTCVQPVNNSVDNSKVENAKYTEKSNGIEIENYLVDKFEKSKEEFFKVNYVEKSKEEFLKMKYQEQLNFIKEKCNDLQFLYWIKQTVTKGAIPLTVNKRIKILNK